MKAVEKRCGYVALVGRPNVGKSTLLNAMLGQKLCITSRKPQTTRHRIVGVSTTEHTQAIFLDTPGVGQTMKGPLNHSLKKTALRALRDVDLALFCLAGTAWSADDVWIAQQLQRLSVPVIVVINKMDLLDKPDLALPHIASLTQAFQEAVMADDQASEVVPPIAYVPISAKKGQGVPHLKSLIEQHLPISEHFFFGEDQVTDRDDAFMVCELIREQCLRRFGQEVPHQLTVQVEYEAVKDDCLHLHACIWVAKEGQKRILLGQRGAHMKLVGTQVRFALEKMYGQKVFLKTWVKVKNDWPNRVQDLRSFGYDGS